MGFLKIYSKEYFYFNLDIYKSKNFGRNMSNSIFYCYCSYSMGRYINCQN